MSDSDINETGINETGINKGSIPPKIPPVRSDDTDEKSGSSSKSSDVMKE